MPAVTLKPSDNFAFANCLASRSLENSFVCRRERIRNDAGRRCFGVSKATYQWFSEKRIVPRDSDDNRILI